MRKEFFEEQCQIIGLKRIVTIYYNTKRPIYYLTDGCFGSLNMKASVDNFFDEVEELLRSHDDIIFGIDKVGVHPTFKEIYELAEKVEDFFVKHEMNDENVHIFYNGMSCSWLDGNKQYVTDDAFSYNEHADDIMNILAEGKVRTIMNTPDLENELEGILSEYGLYFERINNYMIGIFR